MEEEEEGEWASEGIVLEEALANTRDAVAGTLAAAAVVLIVVVVGTLGEEVESEMADGEIMTARKTAEKEEAETGDSMTKEEEEAKEE